MSQSAVAGSGTDGDPYTMVTVVDLGSTGLRLTETDARRRPGDLSHRRIDRQHRRKPAGCGPLPRWRRYLQNSDFGFGTADPATRAVSCVAGVDDGSGGTVPGTRIEQWYPLSSGSSYLEAHYDDMWAAIGTQAPFADVCAECANYIDNAAGISWQATVPAGGSVTRSHLTVFSPLGVVPLTTAKVAGEGP